MEKRFRVTIPQLGYLEIEDTPQGATIDWGNTNYADGHWEGVLDLGNGQTYHIETIVIHI